MKTIQTTILVEPDGRATLQLPADIQPGEHAVVVVIDEPRQSRPPFSMKDFPTHDVGPWPEGFSVRREEIYGDDGR